MIGKRNKQPLLGFNYDNKSVTNIDLWSKPLFFNVFSTLR